jgi:N-acyl-D-amino-acid deacylase
LRFVGGVDGHAHRPDILSPGLVAEMTSSGPTVCAGGACYWGLGWLVRPTQGDATWTHGGSLPGTTTMLVRSYHNFSWVGLFNARSLTPNSEAELNAALWTALAGVTSLPKHDLFATFR